MEHIIYYSDFGLQKDGKLGYVDHELNLKVLLLLSDKILIPASHLIHARKKDLNILTGHFAEYFQEDYIYTQLPREYHSFDQYSYDYLNNYRFPDNLFAISKKLDFLHYHLFPETKNFRVYSIKSQVDFYYSTMIAQIEQDTLISEKTRQDILIKIYDKSDPNTPLSKAYFNNIIQELEHKRRRNIDHLKKYSEICYYSAGAYTNNTIISSNSYLDSKALSEINSAVQNSYSSSSLYNPHFFVEILMRLGIIEDEKEIASLTSQEIFYLKSQKEFRTFLDTYYNLSKSVDRIDEYINKERSWYKKYEFMKSLLFSFGLTMSEAVLSTYCFEVSINPLLYVAVVWLLQAFVENSNFKPIKSIKYYSIDCIIDKIGFSNHIFLEFCHKIKKTIEKC